MNTEKLIYAIISWMVGTAIFALPVWLVAKLVNARLNGYDWAFIATFLDITIGAVLLVFVPTPFIGLPLTTVVSILIFSFTLGISWPKAAVVSLAPIALLVVLAVLSYFLLGEVKLYFYGYEFILTR